MADSVLCRACDKHLYGAARGVCRSQRAAPSPAARVVLMIGFSAVLFYYLSHVDMGSLLDNQLAASNANITDAQREQAVTAATKLSPLFYGAIGALCADFVMFLIVFLVALSITRSFRSSRATA